MGKWFVGMPHQNVKKFSKGILQKSFVERFFRESESFVEKFFRTIFHKPKKNFQDSTRIKYIKQTNKDKVRTYLEKQAHFPQENPSFLMVLKKTILDYFLPFPPEPPLDDKRKCLVEK